MSFHTTNENPAAPIKMRLSDAQVTKASISGRLYLRPIALSDMAGRNNATGIGVALQ